MAIVNTANNVMPSSLMAAMNPTSASTATSGSASANSMQSQFMTLLVTQLQNQDPTNPMDSTQMTSQLAQISTVSGIQQLNTTLQSLMSTYQAGQSVQAASMIGKTVLANGSTLSWNGSQPVGYGVNLSSAADTVAVNVLDASGQSVDTIKLGAQPAGVLNLSWNGKASNGSVLPSGDYTVQVTASNAGEAVAAQPLVSGQVTSVLNDAQGAQLDVAGVGTVSLSSVAQIN